MPTLTLTTHDVAYNLLTLLRAVTGYANAKPTCREMTITADPNNGGTKIRVGGSDVSSSNFSYEITDGGSQTYRSDRNNIGIADKWVTSAADAKKVDIEVSYA